MLIGREAAQGLQPTGMVVGVDKQLQVRQKLFAGPDTPAVLDAMDKLGLLGPCFGIALLDDYPKTVVGPAFTAKYAPATTPPATSATSSTTWPRAISSSSTTTADQLHGLGRYHEPVRRHAASLAR
jgi:hypothetical protein